MVNNVAQNAQGLPRRLNRSVAKGSAGRRATLRSLYHHPSGPTASPGQEDGPVASKQHRFYLPAASFPPGPYKPWDIKIVLCFVFEALKSLVYVGVQRSLCTAGLQGFMAVWLPSKNGQRLLLLILLELRTQGPPLPASLVNQGAASCCTSSSWDSSLSRLH